MFLFEPSPCFKSERVGAAINLLTKQWKMMHLPSFLFLHHSLGNLLASSEALVDDPGLMMPVAAIFLRFFRFGAILPSFHIHFSLCFSLQHTFYILHFIFYILHFIQACARSAQARRACALLAQACY